MKINCKKFKNILSVQINGEIDHYCADEIREYVDAQFRQTNCIHIIFDFSNVSFMDSSGIGMLIGRYKNAGMKGGKVVVCSINEAIKRIFQISGLYKIINVENNFNESLKSIDAEV